MNIVIPLVGEGRRFKEDGYLDPKPLIKIFNKPILQHSVESLGITNANYIFIIREYDNRDWNDRLHNLIHDIKPNAQIISSKILTKGAAESVLLAKKYIDNNEQLLVTNCDQYINWNDGELNNFVNKINQSDCDALVTTYNHIDPNTIIPFSKTPYSFIETNEHGYGINFSEKIAISKLMLNGIHFWTQGNVFVKSAEAIIKKNITYNGEFYISLTFNELLPEYKIKYFQMTDTSFYSLGTPKDLEQFISKRIIC